jgi:hypothetical protein
MSIIQRTVGLHSRASTRLGTGRQALSSPSSTSSAFAGASAGGYPESWPLLGQIKSRNGLGCSRALHWRAVSRREARPARLSNYSPRHIMVLTFCRQYTIKLAYSRLPLYLFQSETITVTLVRYIESSLSYSHELDFTLRLWLSHPVYGIGKSMSCSTQARTTSSSSTPKSNSS